MKKILKKKKGFTLIELIIVIAILGILSAIAVPRLAGFTDSAKVSADKATFATLNNAIAIGVAKGTITTNATATVTAVTGVITTSPVNLIESGAAFKVAGNIPGASETKVFTWTVSNGEITDAPTIADSTGIITP